MVTNFDVLVKNKVTSPVSYEYNLELTTDLHYVYGYGYGTSESFVLDDGEIPTSTSMDYFNVLNVDGDLTGFGIISSKSDEEFMSNYSYGLGFESSPDILGNSSDAIIFSAYVTRRQIGTETWEPCPEVPVTFMADTSVIFNNSEGRVVLTNQYGIATVSISVDAEVKKNIDIHGGSYCFVDRPSIGFLDISAYADLGPGEDDSSKQIKNKIEYIYTNAMENFYVKNAILYGSYQYQ